MPKSKSLLKINWSKNGAINVCIYKLDNYRRRPYVYNLPILKPFYWPYSTITLVISIILFPQEAFEASLQGLNIWWEVVFPANLPFFIAAELLIGFGVVHFLGVLLEPIMKPFFRVPGTGGFVMAMGLSSGYPMGAKLTVRLREQGLITRSEGERLVLHHDNLWTTCL